MKKEDVFDKFKDLKKNPLYGKEIHTAYTRVVVVTDKGRVVDVNGSLITKSVQDNGKTLKLFVK